MPEKPIRTREIELDGDYAGWTATVRTNLSVAEYQAVLSVLDTWGNIGETDMKGLSNAMEELCSVGNMLISQSNFGISDYHDLEPAALIEIIGKAISTELPKAPSETS